MRIKSGILYRRTTIFSVLIMIMTVIIPAIYAEFTEIEEDYYSHDTEVVHIDLDFENDRTSTYDKISITPSRVLRYNKQFGKGNNPISMVSKGNSISIKSINILDSDQLKYNFKDDSNYIEGKKNNKFSYSLDSYFDLEYCSTLSGIKESFIINEYPSNLTGDIVIRTMYNIPYMNVKKSDPNANPLEKTDELIIMSKYTDEDVFTLPPPSYTYDEKIFHNEYQQRSGELEFDYKVKNKQLQYDIIVPKEFIQSGIEYPLIIDPSINSFNGYSEYVGYDNGSIAFNNGVNTVWYNDVDRTIYLESDLNVGLNEELIFNNVNLLVNVSNIDINIGYGGSFSLLSNSTLSKSENCDVFTMKFENGSYGYLFDSKIEKINSEYGIEICSSNVDLDNCIISNNDILGIYINKSSPTISNCRIFNVDFGINISAFSNPNLFGNRINNTKTGIDWKSDKMEEDYDNIDYIEKMVGVEYNNSSIKYEEVLNNIALDCPSLTVDSEWSGGSYPAEKMNDGITSSDSNKWSSDWSSEPHYAEFDFQDEVNVTKFVIYHQSNVPTYDFQIKTYANSAWTTRFTVDDNTQAKTTHDLGSSITVEKVKLYVTDANQALDSAARIREFEIYDSGESVDHYVLSKPISTFGDTLFNKIYLNKSTPGNSNILVSILDGETNKSISGFSNLNSDVIDLKSININKHTSIKIKVNFVGDGANIPTLEGWNLLFSPLKGTWLDFHSSNNIENLNSTRMINGKLQLQDQTLIEEQWESGWDDNWTYDPRQDGGSYEVVEDHWEGSGNDIYLQGISQWDSSGHDGYVIFNRYFDEVSPYWRINTHFSGEIDAYNYNFADNQIILRDESNTSYKRIWWTTRGYSYDTGLSTDKNTYYIVSEDNTQNPCEYEVSLDTSIIDLFESYFGEDEINFTTYRFLEVKALVIENYNQRQNPKFYMDYFILSGNYSESGDATTIPIYKPSNSEWTHLYVDSKQYSTSDIRISLLKQSSSESITGFNSILDNEIDLSSLNNLGLNSFKIRIEMFKCGNATPSISKLVVLTSSLVSHNIFNSNEIGMNLEESSPLIQNNNFYENTEIGLNISSNKTINEYNTFYLDNNIFSNNKIGLHIYNSSVSITDLTFSENNYSLRINNSQIDIDKCNEYSFKNPSIINNSVVNIEGLISDDNNYNLEINNSELTLRDYIYNNKSTIRLENSSMTFIDVYYENITLDLDSQSKVLCQWSVNLKLIDHDEKPKENIEVSFSDRFGSQIGYGFNSGYSGLISDYLVNEREIRSNYQKSYNPINVTFGDNKNSLYLNVIHPISKEIHLFGDFDNDGIMNGDEDSNYTYYFDGLDLAEHHSHGIGYNTNLLNQGTVVVNKLLLNLSESDYKVYLVVRSNEDENNNLTMKIFDENSEISTFDFLINQDFRLYSSPVVSLNNSLVGVNLSCNEQVDSGDIEIQSLIIKDVINSENKIILNPVQNDFDRDELIDSNEFSTNVIIDEAEESIFQSSQIFKDPTIGNGTSILGLVNNSMFTKRYAGLNGNHSVFIKAKSFSSSLRNISIDIDGNTKTICLDNVWNWYFVLNTTATNPLITITKESGSNLSLDKICFYRYYYSSSSNSYLSKLSGVDNNIHKTESVVLNNKWNFIADEKIISNPSATNTNLYYSTLDGSIIVQSRINGSVIANSNMISRSHINFASMPVIENGIGICFFEVDTGWGNHAIVGFNISTLNTIFVINYSNCFSIQNSGIIPYQNMFYYTISNGTNESFIICRATSDGSISWSEPIYDPVLTRPTIDVGLDQMFVGTNAGNWTIIENLLSTHNKNTQTTSPPIDMRSPLIRVDEGEFVTITYNGELVKLGLGGDYEVLANNIDTYQCENVIITFDNPYLFFVAGGNLYKYELDSESQDTVSNSDCSLTDGAIVHIVGSKLIVKSGSRLILFDYDTLNKLNTIYYSNDITEITLVDEYLFLTEMESKFVRCYGPEITDINDWDIDTDLAHDGREKYSYHRNQLFEAEDYHSESSTKYNISAVTMYASNNTDVGYSAAQREAKMNYSMNIEEDGFYSIVIRSNVILWFSTNAGSTSYGNMDYYRDHTIEYLLKSMNIIFSVDFNPINSERFLLVEKGNWDIQNGLGDVESESESGSGGMGYVFEAKYYIEKGNYSFDVNLDIWDDDEGEPYTVSVDGHALYITGATVPIDTIFLRKKGISILDSDCDDDSLLDSFEMDQKLFPLHSDPDKDGISDYYEVYGVDATYSFEYTGTNPIKRDSDLDGIRDRIELGLNHGTQDPYTTFDTTPTLASIYERHVRTGISLTTGTVYNIDLDNETVSDPNDPDTDNDGLPDGVRDGLFFEPLYKIEGDYGPGGRDRWYYSTDLLNYKFEFWEGEDFNLDGKVENASWSYNPFTYRPEGGETDPNNPDCDGDNLTDGWEVWNILNPKSNVGINGADGDADYSGLSCNYDNPKEFLSSQATRTGDGLTNLEEFSFGLNPNVFDTDGEGEYDFSEVYTDLYGYLEYAEYLNTTIKDACVSGFYYGYSQTDEYISYLDDWYEYDHTMILDGKDYKLDYPKNITNKTSINRHLTYLYDGSEIIFNTSSEEIYVIKSTSLLTDYNDDGFVELECVVYDETISEPSNYNWSRYQKIFISDPLKADTENDGLTDREENWTSYSAAFDYFGDYDRDKLPNLRDHDSDNDRLLDGQEYRYYYEYFDRYNKTKVMYENNTDKDLYNDNIPCILDKDSDNDNLEDGEEHIRNGVFLGFMDIDADGYPAMLDIDTDGDGIPDGAIDGYIYDPTESFTMGSFFDPNVESFPTYNDGILSPSEGEDRNLDGLIEGDNNSNRIIDSDESFLETDPYHPDTDRDMLCDGYSPSWIPTVRQNIWNDEVLPIGEWNYSCNNTKNDTDYDGLKDGMEVLGFDLTIIDLDGFSQAYHFDSDPTSNNTDGDSFSDFEEYLQMDPRSSDTDRDNKTDISEIENGTDLLDQDTDNDYLPDYYIDVNQDGDIDKNETDFSPLNPDSDSDEILDGVEVSYLLFRTNTENGDYYNVGNWLYLDPGIGQRQVFWYAGNVSNSNSTYNVSNNEKLNFTDVYANNIYSNLSNGMHENEVFHRFNSSVCNFILINDGGETSYLFLEHVTYFKQLHFSGTNDEFNNIYNPPLKTPTKSLSYYNTDVSISISNYNYSDTDDDGLSDGEELFNLTNSNVMLLLHNFDEDGYNPLMDFDSDGDSIWDYDDLWRNTEDTTAHYVEEESDDWIQSYAEDFDGDGIPNALDNDSDNDNESDGSEDSNHNGKYETNENNPLSDDEDEDGIKDSIEIDNGLDETSDDENPMDGVPDGKDTDKDGIYDGQDGPGNKWWIDIDNDGIICAKDSDSDGDGLEDGYELSIGTSPWKADTDGDGLWDGYNMNSTSSTFEVEYYFANGNKYFEYENISGQQLNIIGELEIGTDPLVDDTDNDGILDGEEVFGYSECGILLNKFEDKEFLGSGKTSLEIPIPGPGNYTLAVFYDVYFDFYLDLELYNDTVADLSHAVSNQRLEVGHKRHFFDLGYQDTFTTYMVVSYDCFDARDLSFHLLKQGLDPLTNDTDSDYIRDGDEIFGTAGYYTHPLSSDSDGDFLPDWKELYYKYHNDGEEILTQIHPLNPDFDKDGVLDGHDLEPFSRYNLNWNNTMMPYVMNQTSWIEYIYPVKHTDGSYSAERVKNGKLTRDALIRHSKDQLGNQYIFTEFHEHTDANLLDTYTYKPYSGYNNPKSIIKYDIKTQRINATYTNRDPIKDEAIHTQFELDLESGYDHEVSFLVSIDGSLINSINPDYNISVLSEYRIFDDYNLHQLSWGNVISFNSFSLYDEMASCKIKSKNYEYYGGNYVYEIDLFIPKEVIDQAYNERYIPSKKLAFDLSISLVVRNDTTTFETKNLKDDISIGCFIKNKNDMAYSLIAKPDVSPYFIEHEIDSNNIDLGSASTSTLQTDEGLVKIINYITSDEVDNNELLEDIAKGNTEYIGLVVIAPYKNNLDEILESTDWSLCWSMEENDSCEYRPYSEIIRNEKTQVSMLPDWWDGSTDKMVSQEILGKINTGIGFATKVIDKITDISIESVSLIHSSQLFAYSSETGVCAFTSTSSYSEYSSYKGTHIVKTTTTSYVEMDGLGYSLKTYGRDTEITFVENEGVSSFLKGVDIAAGSFSVFFDIYTIFCDGKNLITLMENSSTNKVALTFMIIQKTIDDSYSLIKDTVDLVKTIKGIKSVPKIPKGDIIITTLVFIAEIVILATLWLDAPTWIQAHMMVFDMVDASITYAIDMLFIILTFLIPPVGAILAGVWAAFMFVLAITGKEDELKKGIANLLGFTTGEDELAAYQNVTKKISDWVATFTWYPERGEDNVIYLGLYPDISK